MNHPTFFLIFLNVSVILSLGFSSPVGGNSTEDWIDFAFQSCHPSSLEIYDNQVNKNGYSVDNSVDPELFIFELNITKISDTYLQISRLIHVMSNSKNTFEHDSKYIRSAESHSFSLLANRIDIWLIANSTDLESHSVHGSFRLVAENGSLIIDWKDFSLWNCSPTGKYIFKDGKNVHNMTTYVNMVEMGNGTFSLNYHRGSIDAIMEGTEYKSNGSYSFNGKGSQCYIGYYGENGSIAKGWYLLEDYGILYQDVAGFFIYPLMSLVVFIPLFRKMRMK